MPTTAQEGTVEIRAPAQTQPALRVVEYPGGPPIASLIEVQRQTGEKVPLGVYVAPAADQDLRTNAEGFVAQTGPRQTIVSSASSGGNHLRLSVIYFRKNTILSAGWCSVGTNGSGLTLVKIGIFRLDGTLVGATQDMSAAMMAGTTPHPASANFPSPITIPADAAYYVGIVQVGTTPASISMIGGNNTGSWQNGSAAWPSADLSGQNDIAGNINPASFAASGVVPWLGFT